MQGEHFGGKENVWERSHRAHIPVRSSGAQSGEGRVRLPQGSVGRKGLRTDHLGGTAQRRRAGAPPRVRDQAQLRVPKLRNPAQLLSS